MGPSSNKNRLYLRMALTFAVTLGLSAIFLARFGAAGYIAMGALSTLTAFLAWKTGKKAESAKADDVKTSNPNVAGTKRASERIGGGQARPREKKSYGEKVDAILEEGNRALGEMGKLYSTIKDPDIRFKINEIMLITDKIMQDAIEDPSDVPQIRKFFRYYLPTTIKLLHAYDRMSSQGIEGENIDKSISSINEMLDVAIEAYKKRLDSLFENQALDIDTDIDVMNQMLEREGLTGSNFAVQQAGASTAQQKG